MQRRDLAALTFSGEIGFDRWEHDLHIHDPTAQLLKLSHKSMIPWHLHLVGLSLTLQGGLDAEQMRSY